MKSIHTHYDNLKVSRDAPLEVVHAAYKSLCLKYHPDRNLGDPEAARIMKIINSSYEVLSDPIKRQEHDSWIAEQERMYTASEESVFSPSSKFPRAVASSASYGFGRLAQKLVRVVRNWTCNLLPGDWVVVGVLSFFLVVMAINLSSDPTAVKAPSVGSKPYVADPPPETQVYVRPDAAPNGLPWPSSASYIGGYKRLHTDGDSTVMVNNSGNDFDVLIKLIFLDSAQAYPVRVFFIPAHGSFTLKGIRPGSYDIRYRDLSTGGIFRTEPFSLEENPKDGVTQYRNITMTLYKVSPGNMKTYPISEAEF